MNQSIHPTYASIFEKDLIEEIEQTAIFKQISQDTTLINIGDYVKSMPLLLSGAIKVLRVDDKGDELLMYFLETGDTCAMTMSCCLGHTKSEIKAVAELDTELLMIPVQKMEEWTAKYKSWRNFVFESYHNRLQELLHTVDTIAFLNMDERLLKYLKEKAKVSGDTTLHTTHQEIAYDLNTSRVVISRLLKKLETMKKIKLKRNSITLYSF
ncbi:Crp/Fnr family transcriptional regulator [Marixanthomonas ophiurae]|uniref:Crp/Fnr family transcriptional regulator n=1 Tax=Marixanthomonas ophiurae TaxID=387659 RepID=A0A3E1QAE0_9FLAO|nr:Crp/Fnr family transcriptional regulator [Marixanthomonas ophiurae]RFN59102.1 Crp/Fnr family transcriptional regulator [Marixanthomonas ophiurae]